MFLTTRPNTIEDFLKAVNFITPQGYNLQYFVTPTNTDNNHSYQSTGPLNQENSYTIPAAIGAGFEMEKMETIVPGVTDTVVYTKKNLNDTHSFSANNVNLNEVPNALPRTTVVAQMENPLKGMGGIISSPVKLDRRVNMGGQEQDVLIHESYMCFPKNTLFHFVKM